MKSTYILSIDQGTTGSRAIIFNSKGNVVAESYQEIKQYFPKPGWVEQDALDILSSVRKSIKLAIRKAKISSKLISSIGITNQRESIVVWNQKTGVPYSRVIVWQDRRTTDICEKIKKQGAENLFRKKTGLVVDPYFSGTKLMWLFQKNPKLKEEAKKGNLKFGTIDSWLLWNLTGEHATDHTNASRTLLFNIHKKEWDNQLLKKLNIPKNILPRVQYSGSLFGKTKNFKELADGIPIQAICGDQQAALYGQGCYKRGEMKNTYGTGCFLVINTGQSKIISKSGLLTTLACDEQGKPTYALEGSVFIAGALVQWLRDSMKWIKKPEETEKHANSVSDTGGVTVIPAFVGLGAPYWDASARGAILGLTQSTTPSHIIRASLESIAYQTVDLVHCIKKEFKYPIRSLKVDGGVSKNLFLAQFQSDLLGIQILRSQQTESTAWGVAKLAGVRSGIWKSPKQLDSKMSYTCFRPKMSSKNRAELYKNWQGQVKRILTGK